MIRKLILITLTTLTSFSIHADDKNYKMVFVPASEKGDESDYMLNQYCRKVNS